MKIFYLIQGNGRGNGPPMPNQPGNGNGSPPPFTEPALQIDSLIYLALFVGLIIGIYFLFKKKK